MRYNNMDFSQLYHLTLSSLQYCQQALKLVKPHHPEHALIQQIRKELVHLAHRITEKAPPAVMEPTVDGIIEDCNIFQRSYRKNENCLELITDIEINTLIIRRRIMSMESAPESQISSKLGGLQMVATQVTHNLIKIASHNYAILVGILALCKELESQPYLDSGVAALAGKLAHQVLVLTNRIYRTGIEAWEMKQQLDGIGSTVAQLMVSNLEDSADLVREIQQKLHGVVPMDQEAVVDTQA